VLVGIGIVVFLILFIKRRRNLKKKQKRRRINRKARRSIYRTQVPLKTEGTQIPETQDSNTTEKRTTNDSVKDIEVTTGTNIITLICIELNIHFFYVLF
jgi:K+ transporter